MQFEGVIERFCKGEIASLRSDRPDVEASTNFPMIGSVRNEDKKGHFEALFLLQNVKSLCL